MIFLNKEYSKYNSENKVWKNGLFSAFLILLIFLLFQPFGFRGKEFYLKVVLYPGYSILSYLYAFACFWFVRRFLQNIIKWTLWKEIVFRFIGALFLTLAVHVFSYFVTGDMPFSINWYFKLYYHVVSIYLIIGAVEYLYYLNKSANHSNEALNSKYQETSQKLEIAEKHKSEIIPISLENDQIEVNRKKIACIQSKGNYLEFNVMEHNGEIKKLLKRGRLHVIEKDLSHHSEFYKCHRAFIINLYHITSIRGNSKNARAILANGMEEIPVSRTLFKTLTEKLERITVS